MEGEDDFEYTQGSIPSRKGKRGIIWGNAETSILIKVWGEAEIKYALSSLKRNYENFEVISREMKKIGCSRLAEECRSKTKCLRKLYYQAVIQNSTSGAGRSKFLWFEEMAQIFRTDTSIHPLRLTESESQPDVGDGPMETENEPLVTLDFFEATDVVTNSQGASDFSVAEPQDTCNYEATLDPASRLALIRKREKRPAAAEKLDNTLCGFVAWVEENTSRKEVKMSERDDEQKRFHNEVISNM
ncbi:hypothetical protein JRQ81_014374 [Phrynocephalus forsythii]|uniref:Myb/SANT-like DNA-binding domain-containing protein n=1 Tax=Phrynocephalus forsythii TaxID=171643 RepID=A0A9Q0XWM0_9SAUR|nr:hypothetical protein JRQ81_014374 [Phrynocephalus forsythii]